MLECVSKSEMMSMKCALEAKIYDLQSQVEALRLKQNLPLHDLKGDEVTTDQYGVPVFRQR